MAVVREPVMERAVRPDYPAFVVNHADGVGYLTNHPVLDSFARLKIIFTVFTC